MTSDTAPAGTTAVPWIDPDSTEGTAIIDLFRRVKDVERGEDWPGSDVVDQFTAWLPSIGIHPDEKPDHVVRRLRRHRHPWTVFGLRNNDSVGDTLIATVIAGDVPSRDTDSGDESGYQRVAESVIAADADEAERKAYELFEAARDD